MKLDDAPVPPPPPAGMTGEAAMTPPGHAVPSPTPPAAAPPNAQVMHGAQPMQAPPAQPYPAVAATGVPIAQTTAPAAVIMTHKPQAAHRPQRNPGPWVALLLTLCLFWPCCICALVWLIVEELDGVLRNSGEGVYSYKDKNEAWEKKMEAERQHDRAFAMQAAQAAGMAVPQQVNVPMAPYQQPTYQQPPPHEQMPPQQPPPKPV